MRHVVWLGVLGLAAFLLWRGSLNRPQPPGSEPVGQPVPLQQVHRAAVPSDTAPRWHAMMAWLGQGEQMRLQGRFREALYCFHQAQNSFPRWTLPEENQRVPVGAYLEKVFLYSKLGELEWASYYWSLVSREPLTGTAAKNALVVEMQLEYCLGNDLAVEERAAGAADGNPHARVLLLASRYRRGKTDLATLRAEVERFPLKARRGLPDDILTLTD